MSLGRISQRFGANTCNVLSLYYDIGNDFTAHIADPDM